MKQKLLLISIIFLCSLQSKAQWLQNGNHIYSSNSGYVGVGTNNPANKLDVNGDIQISNSTIPMGLMTEVGGVTPLLNFSVNFREPNKSIAYKGAAFRIDTRNELPLFQWLSRKSGVNEEFVIMSLNQDGFLGIGTTTPQNKLDVNGTIRAKEIKVETGWADFVFHPSYQLKSLTEVDKFIKANGHLQDIPSAAEVEQNGVNVGEMQTKLLQKVEELTLYMIEQNKTIKDQSGEIKDLKLLLIQQQKQIDILKHQKL